MKWFRMRKGRGDPAFFIALGSAQTHWGIAIPQTPDFKSGGLPGPCTDCLAVRDIRHIE